MSTTIWSIKNADGIANDMFAALQAMRQAYGNCGAPNQQRAADLADRAITKAISLRIDLHKVLHDEYVADACDCGPDYCPWSCFGQWLTARADDKNHLLSEACNEYMRLCVECPKCRGDGCELCELAGVVPEGVAQEFFDTQRKG